MTDLDLYYDSPQPENQLGIDKLDGSGCIQKSDQCRIVEIQSLHFIGRPLKCGKFHLFSVITG